MLKKILIVDDTKTWLIFHKDLIEKLYGDLFEITLANSAMEAFNIIRHNIDDPFCLVITDLQMETDYEPQLAGEWLIEKIKGLKEYSTSHIVIISAMYNIEQIAEKYNVECISKNMLINNRLLLKFVFEKLMPFLNNI